VETFADARRCAGPFPSHGDEIDGVIVSLPNFGDERLLLTRCGCAAERFRCWYKPPDAPAKMTIAHRRDSFAEKCPLQQLETIWNPLFADDMATVSPSSGNSRKIAVVFRRCRVVKEWRNLRLRDWRSAGRIQTPCATVKDSGRRIALPWKRWIF